jgi:hypothetical protein
MLSMKRFYLGLISLLFSINCNAQFYAPDTEYHDLCQRVFPVEAARVLAWLHPDSDIVEIRHHGEVGPEQRTIW